jgi:flagellar basal body-associated protein FliL
VEKKKNNKGVIALLIVIIIILSALCVLFATGTISLNTNKANENANSNNNTENKNETNQNITIDDAFGKNDTFSASNESGIVEVIGYSETKELDGGEMYPGEKEIYVYFHIKENP